MKYKSAYFIGIKGVGLASLAIIAKQAGLAVAGSDISEEFITDKILKDEKISIFEGFDKKNLDQFLENKNKENCLVVATAANQGLDNIEALYAKNLGIKILTHGQAVGKFMQGEIFEKKNQQGISVAGSHGKTTISAFIAYSISKLGLDPSYTIGVSEIFPLGSAGHFGKGNYFIAEADEYFSDLKYDRTPKFLYQHPQFLIINNIDYDHPDVYKDINEIEEAFYSLAKNIIDQGLIITNGDDQRLNKLRKKISSNVKILTYGVSPGNDLFLEHYYQSEFNTYFRASFNNIELGDFSLSIPGLHNAKNSLAVILLLTELGIPVKKIQEILPTFLGTKRRLELIGKTKNEMVVIDDYAHHPQEIKATLNTLKMMYPNKKIMTVFQPHTFSRTKALLKDFATAFYGSDTLMLMPVFGSMREKTETIPQDLIVEEFNKLNKNVIFGKDKNDVVEYINRNVKDKNTVIITMGAGDIYKVANSLCSQ